MSVPIPERMRRGDFQEVQVCRTLGEQLASEIRADPELRSAKAAHDKGYKAGYEEGHRSGYEKGHAEGYEVGRREGFSRGHDDGEEKGRREAGR